MTADQILDHGIEAYEKGAFLALSTDAKAAFRKRYARNVDTAEKVKELNDNSKLFDQLLAWVQLAGFVGATLSCCRMWSTKRMIPMVLPAEVEESAELVKRFSSTSLC